MVSLEKLCGIKTKLGQISLQWSSENPLNYRSSMWHYLRWPDCVLSAENHLFSSKSGKGVKCLIVRGKTLPPIIWNCQNSGE